MVKPFTISSVASDELNFASHEMENLDVVFMDSSSSASAIDEMFGLNIEPMRQICGQWCLIMRKHHQEIRLPENFRPFLQEASAIHRKKIF
ncbi:hypothetical protein T10_10578 [Trichinella papuae]|uniref:Uncharacterized protein n=1 Tax=Trichinella papuae TaxID=268474 RepID=A0A0V1MAR5_9BILA|nr:hypothetical protein T10_10578 [Trichinella papuae]